MQVTVVFLQLRSFPAEDLGPKPVEQYTFAAVPMSGGLVRY